MEPHTDLSYVRPLHRLCNILAILPPHELGNRPTPVSFAFKFYTCVHIFIVLAIYAYSSYGREKYVYASLDITVVITDKLANLTFTLLNVLLRVFFTFRSSNAFKTFLNSSYHISRKREFNCLTRARFNTHFVIFNLYMAAILIFDAYVWITSLGLNVFQFYVGRSIMFYVCNTTVFWIFQSALLIKHLFTSLNSLLEITLKNVCVSEYIAELRNRTNYRCSDLKQVRRYHNNICDLVDDFNRIYGIIVLAVTVCTICYVLNLTDILLVYASDSAKDIQGSRYGCELSIVCLSWIATLLVSLKLRHLSHFLPDICSSVGTLVRQRCLRIQQDHRNLFHLVGRNSHDSGLE
jgi:hypothetical protein